MIERATRERLCLGEARTDGLWILAAVTAACVRGVCWCLILRLDGFEEAWTWYWVFPNGREKVEGGVVEEASQLVAMISRLSSLSVEGSSRLRFRPGEVRWGWNKGVAYSGCMSLSLSGSEGAIENSDEKLV